jgi:DNA processing protein
MTASPSICIVGSRRASREGAQFASRIAGELSREGFIVTSGLARGIDRAAHRGVLDAEGKTAAVLGCGPDIVYPRSCWQEYDRIVQHGVVLSELLPGAEPRREFFPRRNRIMSGMSVAVVVVEAARRSGALITADMALEEGREVFAVPGSPVNPVSRGTNDLIRQGAHIVESTDDILRELEYTRSVSAPSDGEDEKSDLACCLAGGPKNIDELSRLTGMNPADILTRLAEMEMAGSVTQVPGLRYTLSKSA